MSDGEITYRPDGVGTDIDDDTRNPESDINTLHLLADRLSDKLDCRTAHDRSEMGQMLLRAYLLGKGRDRDVILSDPPELDNVVALPGVDPAKTADNIVPVNMLTRLDLPAEKVLQGALAENLEQAFVVGYCRDGELYTAATTAAGPELLWMLELAKKRLLAIGDGEVPIDHLNGA